MFKIVLSTAIVFLTGCMNGPTFMGQSNVSNQKDTSKKEEVAAKVLEEVEGVIAAEFSASSATPQFLSASSDSTISGAKISIQPNSLAINTTITVEEGGSLASGSMLQQMSGSSSLGVTATTNTVMVMPAVPTDLAQPMTVLISIPDSSGLLQTDNPALIVIYKIFKKSEDKWFYGFITRDKLKIVGSFVEFPTQHFGAFQAAILNTEVKEPAKEIVSESSAISKKEEKAMPQVVWGEYKLAFEGSDRSISISLVATGHQELESCELYGDSDEVAPYEIREKIEKFSAKAKINFNRAATLTFSVSCHEKNGRVSQSPWSQKLSIPELVIVSDNIAPTITLSATQTSPTNVSTINMTAQFSETVSGFDIADINVANGSKGSFVAVDGDTYTFNITSPSGTVTVNVAGSAAKDSANNNNTAATPFSMVYDNTAPTVTVSAAQTSPTNASTINMTVQFSESVSGFSLDDITVANGTKSTFTAVDGDTYTFNITSPSGTVTVDVAGSVAQDSAANSNTAASQFSIVYDNTVPTITLSATQTSPTNTSTINMTVQFSENVIGFDIGDITVANGTKGTFTAVDGDTYTFNITAPSGTVTVDIASSVATDSASNNNTAATQFSIVHDNTAPTITLSSTQSSPVTASTINMTVQFSESVTGFALADIAVVNGTGGNFTAVNGEIYTFDITAPSSTITVNISSGVAHDSASNGNSAATQYSLTMANPPNLTGQTSQTYTTGVTITPISFTNTGEDATSCSPTPALPAGLSVGVDNYTCRITGTPIGASASNTYTITATAADTSTDSATIDIQVNAAVPPLLVDRGVYTSSIGNSVTIIFTNSAAPAVECTIDLALPDGLILSNAGGTCRIDGTATESAQAKIYTITGTAVDGSQDTATVDLEIKRNGNLSRMSAQRVVVYDAFYDKHWLFHNNASSIKIAYSLNKKTWIESTPLVIDTLDFTVISKNGLIFLSYQNGYSTSVKRGTIVNSDPPSITWTDDIPVITGTNNTPTFNSAMTISNNKLYVGAFQQLSGSTMRKPIVTVSNANFDQSLTFSTYPMPYKTNAVGDLALAPYGINILAVINGTRDELRSFVFNGSTWSEKGGTVSDWWTVAAPINGAVRALAVVDNHLYVGGQFTDIDGSPRSRIAKWDGAAWSNLGAGVNGDVLAMTAKNGFLYVGGTFTGADVLVVSNIAKWDTSTNTWSQLGGGANGTVYALTSDETHIYVGGSFNQVNGNVNTSNIAKLSISGDTWSEIPGGVNGNVFALQMIGSDLYVGGTFTAVGNLSVAAENIAKFNGTTWNSLGGGAEGEVTALAASGSNLYVGGFFSTVNDGAVSANNIAKWTGSSWVQLGLGVNNAVKAIKVVGNKVYAGGNFTTAGGSSANGVATWESSAWSNPGSVSNGFVWDPVSVSNGIVWDLESEGNDLYVGANFSGPNLAVYRSTLVAKATSFSITGDASQTYLAFIHDLTGNPSMRSFSGLTWSGETTLNTVPTNAATQIQLSVTDSENDNSRWIAFWNDSSGNIRSQDSTGPGSLDQIAGPSKSIPWCPTHYNGTLTPVLWHTSSLLIGHTAADAP
jgi:hypothetical protein